MKYVHLPLGISAVEFLVALHGSYGIREGLDDSDVVEDPLPTLRVCLDGFDHQPLPGITLANLAPLHRASPVRTNYEVPRPIMPYPACGGTTRSPGLRLFLRPLLRRPELVDRLEVMAQVGD